MLSKRYLTPSKNGYLASGLLCVTLYYMTLIAVYITHMTMKFRPLLQFTTNRSKAVVFCGSMSPVFCVRVSVSFYFTCVHINFSSFSVAGWPPFGK